MNQGYTKTFLVPAGIILAIALVAVALYAFLPGSSDDDNVSADGLPQGIVLYYGDTCPHCKNVDQYVAEHAIHSKVDFVEKEVYRDRAHAAEMRVVVDRCGVGSGVPLLWDGQTCYVGDQDIIAFFSEKISAVTSAQE